MSTRDLGLVDLSGRGARVLILVFLVTMAALALWSIEGVRAPVSTAVAAALFTIACVVAVRDRGTRMSLLPALIVITIGVANTILLSWHLIHLGYTQWYLCAAVVALFYLCLRRRVLVAWVGMAGITAVMLVWGATTAFGVDGAILAVAEQLPILIVGTLFATGLRRSATQIRSLNEQITERAAREADAEATALERHARMRALEQFVTPMLERLASGETPTAAERTQYALAEAELRDGLRAGVLMVPEVVAAARAARQRGVDVVLLDDSAGVAPESDSLALVSQRVVAALDAGSRGTVTARLLPPERGVIATIVVDGEHYSREDITPAD